MIIDLGWLVGLFMVGVILGGLLVEAQNDD